MNQATIAQAVPAREVTVVEPVPERDAVQRVAGAHGVAPRGLRVPLQGPAAASGQRTAVDSSSTATSSATSAPRATGPPEPSAKGEPGPEYSRERNDNPANDIHITPEIIGHSGATRIDQPADEEESRASSDQ